MYKYRMSTVILLHNNTQFLCSIGKNEGCDRIAGNIQNLKIIYTNREYYYIKVHEL
jgi:hypothetical protein